MHQAHPSLRAKICPDGGNSSAFTDCFYDGFQYSSSRRLTKRNLMRIWLAILLCLAACCAHAADVYPNKPIRIIITVAPGGGSDITARAIGQKLIEAWGQQVVVDNRPGGNGIVGM